jgi:alpha-glucosidase
MQYVDEHPVDQLRVRIWQGNGEFTLYEDDGTSYEYQLGAWATTRYRVQQQNDTTRVEVGARHGNWQPTQRTIIVELVGVGEQTFTDDGEIHQLRFS